MAPLIVQCICCIPNCVVFSTIKICDCLFFLEQNKTEQEKYATVLGLAEQFLSYPTLISLTKTFWDGEQMALVEFISFVCRSKIKVNAADCKTVSRWRKSLNPRSARASHALRACEGRGKKYF